MHLPFRQSMTLQGWMGPTMRRTAARRGAGAISLTFAISCALPSSSVTPTDRDWPITGGDTDNSRSSPLAQIDRNNVRRLEIAWTYRTGDSLGQGSQIQATPIVVHGVLYSTTPRGNLFALHAGTGEQIWKFDPGGNGVRGGSFAVNRGVAYWEEGDDHRIFYPFGSRLFAVDARTGQAIRSFGVNGSTDLSKGLGRDSANQLVVATSPGVIFRDLIIQGTRVGEGEGSAPGHIRAFDVRTGAVRWIFHTIPQPGEYGHDTWPRDAWRSAGGANSWAGMTVDVARGIVYVPTGSAAPDFYGGDRLGANLFANSLLAIDAATGRRIWHFQTVHHDLLDRDLPAAPNLVTVSHGGRRVEAVAQIAKSGFIFLFDRATGLPLFSVEERPVPASTIAGEQAWPTQPFPTKPAPFARQRVTAEDITTLTPDANAAALARFRTLRSDGPYTPPSLEGSVVFPGFDGGGEWGGAAVDRETGVLYVNSSDVPWIAALAPQATAVATISATAESTGLAVYRLHCASCHGADRRGDGGRSPSLIGVGTRLDVPQIRDVMMRGKGFMPSFASLRPTERESVIAHLIGTASAPSDSTVVRGDSSRSPQSARPRYRFRGYERWRDAKGYPAVKPPWGTLNAIDLNTGEYLWKIPLGEHAALTAIGIPTTGTEQYGGPIVTAGGLLFIAATQDERFRAFDKRTGALLWETTLPAAGYATPSTYMVDGRQYVVIAAGGGKLGTKSGDAYVAYALP
jgi:quinoprotein glucose dehydrogenase